MIACAALSAFALILPSTAAASGPKPFTAGGLVAIVDPGITKLAGGSGRTVTNGELVASLLPMVSNWAPLNGGSLVVGHASNAKIVFDNNGNLVSVGGGTSRGKFTLNGSDGKQYTGSYETKLSSTAGCAILDSGSWVLNSGGAHARGTLNVCLNPYGPTFAGQATMSGVYN